jgi:hypothetical protein
MYRVPLLLTLMAPLTTAVSLSDFIPLLQGLPSACEAAYTATIPGCVAGDFESPYVCSDNCLQGLVTTNGAITTACKGVSVDPQSIVGLFLNGDGIQALCNVAVVTTTTSGASSAMPLFATSSGASQSGSMPTITMVAPMASSSSNSTSSSMSSPSRSVSSMLKTSKSSTSAKTSATAVADNAKPNPSKPNCSDQGSTGSPFDSFTDQTCEKNDGSTRKMSPFAAFVGLLVAVLMLSR